MQRGKLASESSNISEIPVFLRSTITHWGIPHGAGYLPDWRLCNTGFNNTLKYCYDLTFIFVRDCPMLSYYLQNDGAK